jgi:AcrR family transcriptional regulator
VTVRTRRRPGRPTGTEHVIDRDTLLDVAERVIARDGSGASLEAIAVEAGVTKPIVYARVGSRAALSNALAERLAARLIEAGSVAVAARPLDQAMLAALFGASLETLEANRELFLYVTRGASDDMPERTLYLAAMSAEPLAALLADRRAEQGLDLAVAAAWSYGIVGMVNMVSVWWLEHGDRSASVVADQIAELVWSGIAGAGSADASVRGRRRQ